MAYLRPVSPASDSSLDDLDLSILRQVKVAIQRVADVQTDEERGHNQLEAESIQTPNAVCVGELEEQCVQCGAELERLEREVALLEDELARRLHPFETVTDLELEKAILGVDGADSALLLQSDQASNENIRLLRSKVTLNSRLSGIKFSTVDWQVTKRDKDGLFRKYDHVGTAHGFEFHTQFVAREEKDPLSESPELIFARIIALRVKVDPRIEKPLVPMLTKCSSEFDLMGFYQNYSKFCACIKQRWNAFLEAHKLYRDCVHLSEDQLASELQCVVGNGSCLTFDWEVGLGRDGTVSQSLTLHVKASENVHEEERELMSRLRQLLVRMVEHHGCRQALLRTLKHLNQT